MKKFQLRNFLAIMYIDKVKVIESATAFDLKCRYKPEDLPRISRESGVNMIVGTSFYIDPFIPEDVKLLSVEEVQLLYGPQLRIDIMSTFF